MSDWRDAILTAAAAMSAWEVVAVALAIAYLVLAARESLLCWACAFVSTAIFTVLFWDVSLLMDSALNVYYMAMAIYGWQQWRGGTGAGGGIPIKSLAARQHVRIIGLVAVLTLVSGYLLSANTQAAWPFVDSFTTWASVITTYLVAKKVLENWIYWFVIDAVSVPLYIERELYLTAALFIAYLVIVVFGFLAWRRQYGERRVIALAA